MKGSKQILRGSEPSGGDIPFLLALGKLEIPKVPANRTELLHIPDETRQMIRRLTVDLSELPRPNDRVLKEVRRNLVDMEKHWQALLDHLESAHERNKLATARVIKAIAFLKCRGERAARLYNDFEIRRTIANKTAKNKEAK